MLTEIGLVRLVAVVAVAGVAGFVTGLVGFGTGLVSIGLWLQVLPASLVPPLVVVNSVASHVISLPTIRRVIRWRVLSPYLAGALVGVPFGVLALGRASPALLRPAVGLFLIAFVSLQNMRARPRKLVGADNSGAQSLVGASSGFLGGFAGLSGPLLIVWLRLRGGSPDSQRAIYQPFNLLVLTAAALVMSFDRRIDLAVLTMAGFCFPATLLGARLGVHYYRRVSEIVFKRVVLGLLLASGLALLLLR